MGDLLERLRALRCGDCPSSIEREAADYIEALEYALRWIAVGDSEVYDDELECMVEISADSDEMQAVAQYALGAGKHCPADIPDHFFRILTKGEK